MDTQNTSKGLRKGHIVSPASSRVYSLIQGDEMIYLARFSREYCVEIEAESEAQAWDRASSLTPAEVERLADHDSAHLWSVEAQD